MNIKEEDLTKTHRERNKIQKPLIFYGLHYFVTGNN